ncbi:MAG: phenylalanine--tRNA ligase subunit alpha, partial [Clostridia bacterium]|nr:phenylalanine--tRNA ligase subunit alpha [Clostridia bacterium]
MKERFDALKLKAKEELEKVTSSIMLVELKAKYVGKNGEVTGLLRGMKDIPADQRAEFGKMVNDLKVEITEMFNQKEVELKEKETKLKFEAEKIDVTLPAKTIANGSQHPLNIVKQQIFDAF